MEKLKNLHPFEKALILSFLFLAMVALISCGSIKKVEQSSSQTHEVVNVDSTVKTNQRTATKFYGDTLRGSTYVVLDTAKKDTGSINIESNGILFHATIIPQTNKGTVSGALFNFTAIAKPVAQTDAKTQTKSAVHAVKTTDAKASAQTTTTTKAGFSLPWYCYLILAGLLALAAFLFINRIKNLI